MHPKRLAMITALAITFVSTSIIVNEEVMAYSPAISQTDDHESDDDFLLALGVESDDEIYAQLYDGKSLADIATAHDRHADAVIQLQLAEMTKQLDLRLQQGQITPAVYTAQKRELVEIITKSVYNRPS